MSKEDQRTACSSEQGDLCKKKDYPAVPAADRLPAPRFQCTRRQGGHSGEDLNALTKKLKQESGIGGAVKDGVIEIQGEQRQKVAVVLQKLGYKVKWQGHGAPLSKRFSI